MNTPVDRGGPCAAPSKPPIAPHAPVRSTALWRLAAMLVVCATSLIATPEALAQSGSSNTTFTTSTSSSEVLHDSSATQRNDTFVTQIIGRVDGGATLFDQSYSFAYGSSQVAAGIGDAQAALTSYFGPNPFSLFGPTLLGSTQSLVSSVTGAPLVTGTTPTETITLEDTIGPGTIIIGNRDLGGTAFEVLAGTSNVNVNVHTQFDIFRTITTTNTYNTVASYEIIGHPVPEPSTWALLASGLALLGWRARRKASRSSRANPSGAIASRAEKRSAFRRMAAMAHDIRRKAPLRGFSALRHERLAAMLVVCATSLIATPDALAQSTANNTFTTSTSSSEVLHDSSATQRNDTFVTQIIGRIDGGPTLFDQTYSFAYGSSQVAAGIGDAQAALTSYFASNPFSLFGPTLLGSTQSLVSSVTGAPVVTNTTPTETITLEDTIGPGTIIIGNRDLGGTAFDVLAGTGNTNINTHTHFDIFRTITTTNTFNTVASYEIIGHPVPEPSTWALLASGLMLLGWKIRRSA